ncbi:MAG: sigma-70 family RNA polymerase sigma factor [Bacteroidota bacterium]
MSKSDTQKEMLDRIRSGDQQLLKTLYEEYREAFLAWSLKYYKLDEEEIIEVFQKAFTIFYFNIKEGKLYELSSSLKTYLFGIGKHLYLKKFTAKKRETLELDDQVISGQVDLSIMDRYRNEDAARLVRSMLQQMGEMCRQLLELIFLKEYSTDAVMHTMQLKNEQAVRKRKFNCLKKLRALVAESGVRF